MTTSSSNADGLEGEPRSVSRRSVLLAVAGGSLVSTTGRIDSTNTVEAGGDLHVRVYPGPVPIHVWARYGGLGMRSGWPVPFQHSRRAIGGAVDQLTDYLANETGVSDVEARVETGDPISFPYRSSDGLADTIVPDRQRVLDGFRTQLHERGEITGSTSHVLLWWGPFDYALGYGGTRSPNGHVARVADEGAQTVVNVGATEVWDSRPVTRNLAIHETFHTLLSGDVVESVVESRCDHDLGTVTRTDTDTLRVSPMATAYAGPDRVGADTRWHGSGCYNHDAFYAHDGYTGEDQWEHTTELSDGTLDAASEYVLKYMIDGAEPPDAISTATRT